MASRAAEVERTAAAVGDVVQRVFATVGRVHAAALAFLSDDGAAGRGRGEELARRCRELLQEPDQLAIGLGLVVAPRPERGLPMRLHWWQAEPDGRGLRALDPDLRPASLGFYDYATTEWFTVPRRTGRRHVVGPYVDVHGTGRYLFTLTEPLVVHGEFHGVAGADVPVSAFEAHLVRRLAPSARPFLLLNAEGRVVLSTSPQWVVGSLVDPAAVPPGTRAVPGAPWAVHVAEPVRRGA